MVYSDLVFVGFVLKFEHGHVPGESNEADASVPIPQIQGNAEKDLLTCVENGWLLHELVYMWSWEERIRNEEAIHLFKAQHL
jgi:hypothetical protein